MCYKRVTLDDTRDDYAPMRRSGMTILEDYEFIKATHGGTLKQIAERMDIRYDTLWHCLRRHGVKHEARG